MSQELACAEAAAILAVLNKGGTIGVMYLGVAISMLIYGITCIQTFQYYRSDKAKDDKTWLRTIVGALWVLDTVHQALIIRTGYHYLIINYANPVALLENSWSISAEIIVNAVIAFVVESFFVLRIWRLSQNYFVTGACLLFTVAHLVMNLVYPIRALFYKSLTAAEDQLTHFGSGGLCVAVLADVSISAAMVWYLRKGKSGIRRSDGMINRLIALTITTGLLTTLVVIANLLAFLIVPSLLYSIFFNFMLGKLYINALLTSLNSRMFVRGAAGTVHINSVPLSTFHAHPGRSDVSQVDDITFAGTTDAGTLSKEPTKSNGSFV